MPYYPPLPGHRPPLDVATTGALVVALAAVSSSAPLIAFAAAPALAIAFWRNALAVGVLGPFSLVRRRAEVLALFRVTGGRELRYCLLAGVALAAHFATWIPSVRLTSVAAASALVATQPVWQGLIARSQGRWLPPAAWAGIALAVAGAGLATGADFAVSGRAVTGDLLAVAGGLAAAGYTAFGERARVTLSTITYTTICYGVCAIVLLPVCLVAGLPLTGYDTATWLAIGALVAGAQLLGHSMFNYALHRVPATTISVLVLLEAPGAAVIAWVWLRQTPPVTALPGLALLLAGVAVVLLGGARSGPADRQANPTARSLARHNRPASSGSVALGRGRRNRRSA